MARKAKKSSWEPLESILGSRVKGLIRALGLSHREVARRIASGRKPESLRLALDNIVAGKQLSMRRDERCALAALADIPEQWLRDEASRLPFALHDLSAQPGDKLPTLDLLQHWLGKRIYAAVRRDVADGLLVEGQERRVWNRLMRLTDACYWRNRLLLPGRWAMQVPAEGADESLTAALEFILQPWLDGDTLLAPENVERLTNLPFPSVPMARRPTRKRPAKRPRRKRR